MQHVYQWLEEGRTLVWWPILNRENFPHVPREILHYAERCPDRHVWLIDMDLDFFQIPEGIVGWLMPKGNKVTNIAVGRRNGVLRFVKFEGKCGSAPQIMLSGKVWDAVDADAYGVQRVAL